MIQEKFNFEWYTTKQSFSTQSPGWLGQPIHIQVVRMGFPFLVRRFRAQHTRQSLVFCLLEAEALSSNPLLPGKCPHPESLDTEFRGFI